MKKEVLADQVVRIATECARRSGVPEAYVEDCAMNFLYLKVKPEDFSETVRRGEEETKLIVLAEKYARGLLQRLRKRAKKEVSLTGEDGSEARGPAGHLVCRRPGPEEMHLRQQIRELVGRALSQLTPRQREIYLHLFEREERAMDQKEAMGCSAAALWQAKARLRKRLHHLLLLAGVDDETVKTMLNELERLRTRLF